MKKQFIYFNIINTIILILLTSKIQFIVGALILLSINLFFYFIYFLKKEKMKNNCIKSQDVINLIYMFSCKQNDSNKCLDFIMSNLNEDKEEDLKRKLDYLIKKYNLRIFFLIKELMISSAKKERKIIALRVCKDSLNTEILRFQREEKELYDEFIYIFQINIILLVIKFLFNLQENLILNSFYLGVFIIEMIFIFYSIKNMYKVEKNGINNFMFEYLVRLNYQTPFASFENSLYVLEPNMVNDFKSVLSSFKNNEYEKIVEFNKKYQQLFLKDFVNFAFTLSFNNTFQDKDQYEFNRLVLSLQTLSSKNKSFLVILDVFFSVIVLFLIYYLINNYGTL